MTLIESLITAYGFIAIASISVMAAIVWLISHFAAKPGGKVSVLWGLATYDRRGSNSIATSFLKPRIPPMNTASNNKVKKSVTSVSNAIVIAKIDDSLLLDTETQRASSDLIVYKGGQLLNQLAIVSLTLESQSSVVITVVNLHLKRKRPGELISALPQILGDVKFQNSARITPLGIQITLMNMHPGERFRLQMLTNGLRATDFHLVQEPRNKAIELIVEKSEDWQP